VATILTVGNSEGSRSCTAKCHNATEPDCDCVCGGAYHGKGAQAQQLMTNDILDGKMGQEMARAIREVSVQLGLSLEGASP
jgi:hypothetical protein